MLPRAPFPPPPPLSRTVLVFLAQALESRQLNKCVLGAGESGTCRKIALDDGNEISSGNLLCGSHDKGVQQSSSCFTRAEGGSDPDGFRTGSLFEACFLHLRGR